MAKYPFFESITLNNIIQRLKSEYHVLKKDLNPVFGYPKRLERILKEERKMEAYECEKLFSFMRSRVLSASSSLADTFRKWFPALMRFPEDTEVEEAVRANLLGTANADAWMPDSSDNVQSTSDFILRCMENASPITTVRMAFHTGWAWVRDSEKADILEELMKRGISVQVLANPGSVIKDFAVGFRNPALELRYSGFNETLAEWHKYADAYPNLSVRVSLLPILRQTILVEFCDGSARGFFRDYVYGSARIPAVVKNADNDPSFSLYVKELTYLWERSMDYGEWHASLPKTEEVMQAGEYILLYPRHGAVVDGSENEDPEWIYSTLSIGVENQIVLYVNVTPSAKLDLPHGEHEYTYSGKGRLTRNNIFLSMQDERGQEAVNISIVRPLHDMGRFLGLLSALSPSGMPVSFKCALLRPETISAVNKSVLHDILCRWDHETGSLMAFELQDVNLFYSNKIFL